MIGNSLLLPSRRRMVVQLASLVDLLFVILFLQYMQLRLTSQRQAVAERVLRSRAEQAAKSARDNELSAKALTETAMAGLRKLEDLQNENRRLNDELNTANKQVKELKGKSKEAEEEGEKERQALGDAARKMLGVDITPVLKDTPTKDIETITKALAKLKAASPSAIVQHLRQTVEIQKLCSIWDVHVYADGNVRLRFGDTSVTFRPKSEDDFADRFCATAREVGEPKSLVVVMWTFEDAQLSTRTNVKKGLEKARLVLKSGWSGNKRIEIATEHYSATAP